MSDRRTAAALGAAAAALLAIVVLGAATTPKPDVISTDRLGPESGEPVADYLSRSRESLSGTDTAQHWALLSLTTGIGTAAIPEHVAGLRISQVILHVPIDRVYTPPITVPVPAGTAAVLDAQRAAAGTLRYAEPTDDRSRAVTAAMTARLRADCPCVTALVLRGTLPDLRKLAATKDIRAVQALPADASAGTFAVVPLLPEQLDTAVPGPDDGPVPAP
ncbi:hypothetical protein [Nocardia sp. alder85J]|uniref:hypothetical protein n=1 Tax=Nocardia sp. alder85J TaxID=2862949 RepID=UPI001CD7CC40|nr:hypothetical protein [Nocardia sp. alder85J]MCX4095221.1 hypothetical protein [Nocardia sp. alder85J]